VVADPRTQQFDAVGTALGATIIQGAILSTKVGTSEARWTSSNESIVSVSQPSVIPNFGNDTDGYVVGTELRATGLGRATVTITYAGVSDTVEVIVGTPYRLCNEDTDRFTFDTLPLDGFTLSADNRGRCYTNIISPTVTIAPASAAVTVAQGSTASNTINITRTNYTGSVSLALVNLPPGVTATITPNPTTANAFSISLSASATATVGGPVTVTCTATYDVDKTATTTLTLVIEADSVQTRIVTYAKTPLAAGYTLPSPQTVNVNTSIMLPESPSAAGYTFDGWFVGNQQRFGAQTITTNTTFTARFTLVSDGGGSSQPPNVPVTFSPPLTPLVFTYQRGTTVYPLPVQITATNNSSRQHTVKLDTNQQFNFIKNGITTTGTLTFIVPPNSSQAFAIVPLQGLFTVGGLLDGDTQFPITVTDS
jgi:uncharacterized repeat protein (TIGR02543 family)